jgi:imidazolonepropionase-like amidohydrolase
MVETAWNEKRSSGVRIIILMLGAALLASAPALAGEPNSFAVRDVRVFDGERVLLDRTVIVRKGRIAAVGVGLPIPRNIAVIEGAGKTLIPGLIDAHVHVFPGAQRDALRFGVTTVIDMFSLTADFAAWRAQREGWSAVSGADTWSAGIGASSPGGHPAKMLPPDWKLPTLVRAEDAEAFVSARVAEGSDFVKLILEHNSLSNPPQPLPTLSRDSLCAAIAATHARRRKAIVHVSQQADAREALACGADGLAHLFSDQAPDPGFVRHAATRGIFFETTLSVLAGVSGLRLGADLAADPRVAPFLSEGQKRSLTGVFPTPHPGAFERGLVVARVLHAAGVPLLAGTDAPGPATAHGVSIHQELGLLTRAGLTPLQALAAATALPAAKFGLADRGRVAKGYRADLILVGGNPIVAIADTLSIVAIWKNGYRVDRRP